MKPDIAAPGDVIVSTMSKDEARTDALIAPDNRHVTKRGTSMATPHVAGAVALLLSANPNLDSAQIKGLLQSTAVKDGFTGPSCGNVWGCGKLNLAPLANTAPIALDDSATVEDGGTVTVLDSAQASVLANDSDPESDLLAVDTAPVSGPANGNLTLNANGTFSYTHNGTGTTTDGFTYRVCDDASLSRCATATVTITVNPVAPSAPVLVSPVDAPARESFLNTANPFFEWTPSAGDVFDYLLQVTSADTFNPHLDIEVLIIHPGTGHQAAEPPGRLHLPLAGGGPRPGPEHSLVGGTVLRGGHRRSCCTRAGFTAKPPGLWGVHQLQGHHLQLVPLQRGSVRIPAPGDQRGHQHRALRCGESATASRHG